MNAPKAGGDQFVAQRIECTRCGQQTQRGVTQCQRCHALLTVVTQPEEYVEFMRDFTVAITVRRRAGRPTSHNAQQLDRMIKNNLYFDERKRKQRAGTAPSAGAPSSGSSPPTGENPPAAAATLACLYSQILPLACADYFLQVNLHSCGLVGVS